MAVVVRVAGVGSRRPRVAVGMEVRATIAMIVNVEMDPPRPHPANHIDAEQCLVTPNAAIKGASIYASIH